jgi:hypothetical protein
MVPCSECTFFVPIDERDGYCHGRAPGPHFDEDGNPWYDWNWTKIPSDCIGCAVGRREGNEDSELIGTLTLELEWMRNEIRNLSDNICGVLR